MTIYDGLWQILLPSVTILAQNVKKTADFVIPNKANFDYLRLVADIPVLHGTGHALFAAHPSLDAVFDQRTKTRSSANNAPR